MGTRAALSPVDWERAADALASLVRAEYPLHYSLAEIAETWGEGVSPEQIDALRRLENQAEK
jgi:hypothetical protein